MASKDARPNRMKRLESMKSHSWWWDSHISHKNSKWVLENLEEMEEIVRRILKIVQGEEDVDSFAKKAELYFKSKTELVNLVEEFYRMYRSLAERYNIVSGKILKTMHSDLVSQGSGNSDVGSEQSTGSELETDDSSIDNDNITTSNDCEMQESQQKNIEFMKEKLQVLQEETDEGHKKFHDANAEFSSLISVYEEEQRVAKEQMQQSQEEVAHLTMELQKYHRSLEDSNNSVTDPKVLDSSSLQGPSPALNIKGDPIFTRRIQTLPTNSDAKRRAENRQRKTS
ncbi:uncharacterized protein [Henckelia pumila]|uniref:uncharacterized protein n=1 Tax=Henckelia pumila TaxID=405737 RepID=UPI003C6E2D9E